MPSQRHRKPRGSGVARKGANILAEPQTWTLLLLTRFTITVRKRIWPTKMTVSFFRWTELFFFITTAELPLRHCDRDPCALGCCLWVFFLFTITRFRSEYTVTVEK